MLVYSDTKIYVFCPGNYNGEIADNCHRLASQLLRLGIDTKMIYTPNENFSEKNPVHDDYKNYDIPYDNAVEDEEKNILIVPEISTRYLYFTTKIQRVIWWVSVVNFLQDVAIRTVNHFSNILTEPMPKNFCFGKADEKVEHLVQSEYARQFLLLNGVPDEKIYLVSDYIDSIFLDNAGMFELGDKKNIVAYRPTKGLDFTDVVKAVAADIEWRPVDNADPKAIQKLFNEAKVYVDFGEHLSKDRLTREAAICDCVVITGKRGAAANSVDINIPDEFKFDETIEIVPYIVKKIREIFDRFEFFYNKQEEFRDKIFLEKDRFPIDVELTFGVDRQKDESIVAIIHGLNSIGVMIAELLLEQDIGFTPKFIVEDSPRNLKEVTRERNRTFFNLRSGNRLEIISGSVAKCLYNEGRISKFVRFTNDEEEDQFIDEVISPDPEDVVNTAFED